MDPNTINAIAAVASAAAASASLILTLYISRRTEWFAASERARAEALAAAERERAEALAAAERRQSSFNTVAEWRRDLREWAVEAIDVLSEASYTCADPSGPEEEPSVAERAVSCRYRLSSLIDRGRFFLPNIRRDEHGTSKPYAYRGFRHSALDPLVAAERVLSGETTGRFENRKYALVAMKREFVSSIQRILDPDHHNQEVGRMIREGHEKRGDDPTLGGLLPTPQHLPSGAESLLWNPPSAHLGLGDAPPTSDVKKQSVS